MLLLLAYLGVTNALAMLRLLQLSATSTLKSFHCHTRFVVLQRQLGEPNVRFEPGDRALLAVLVARLPMDVLRRLQQTSLLV